MQRYYKIIVHAKKRVDKVERNAFFFYLYTKNFAVDLGFPLPLCNFANKIIISLVNKRILNVIIFLFAMLPVMTENMLALEDSIVVDTAGNVLRRYKRTDKPVLKPFYSLYNFLANSNKMSDRNYDGGFVCGPSYNATTCFSVGGAYTALYSYDRKDSTLQKSVLSGFFNISIKGNAAVGLEGHNYMKRDKMRWNYELIFTHNPSRYWGVGYDNGCNPDRMIEFNQFMIDLIFDWRWKLAENLYVGPCVDVQYTNTFKHTVNNLNQTMGEMMLIDGLGDQPHAMLSSGVGVDMVYDSRDFAMNAYRGNYFRFPADVLYAGRKQIQLLEHGA